MLNTPCPYCENQQMPVPPDTTRPFGKCPACGRKSRAVISHTQDGTKLVRYVACNTSRLAGIKLVAARVYDWQAELLDKELNASETIRVALNLYYQERK